MSVTTTVARPAADAPGRISGLVRAVRPRQWTKNVLVFAAPVASGHIADPRVLGSAAVAFVAFSAAASAVYLVNDVLDRAEDRAHPTKCRRPIAAGLVSVGLAVTAAVVLFVVAVVLAALVTPVLAVVLLAYEVLQLGYCLGLKHQTVIELCLVSSGFLLRSIAGGVAGGIVLSRWFLLATAFGSLFMVAGKRYAEVRLYEATGARIRRSLTGYSASYLRFVWTLAATVLVSTYVLWAFEIGEGRSLLPVLSIVPFTVGVLRYAVDVDGTTAGAPEEVVLADRTLQAIGAVWAGMLALAVYTG